MQNSGNERKTLIYNVLLFIFISILCVITLEWLLRIYVFDPNASYLRTPGWRMHIRTNGLLPKEKIPGDHTLTVNRLGIRGAIPEFGDTPKIAVLGGSTVEDWLLTDKDTWPQQLAKTLRGCAPTIWVANLGKSGTNARHHLLQLPEVEKYMPHFDMFVVLMGLNDFLYDLHIHHPVVTPTGWWQQQAFQSTPGDEGSLALVAITKRLWRQYIRSGTEPPAVSDFGNYMKSLWDAHSKVTPDQKVATLPDISEHLKGYQETIRSLKRHADAYGVPIVFVTQPFVWSNNMSEEAKAQIYAGFIGSILDSPQTKWYTPGALEKGLSAYNATLLAMCKSDNLLCVDAAAQMREASFFFDDFHFSKYGAATIGSMVAQALRPQIAACR